MTTAVKRACDACHRRKVKCDGVNPCRNCSAAQLSCTYNAIPQKKGPKGSRAKVISELRETQRQTSLSAKVHGRANGAGAGQSYPSLAPTLGLLSPEMVKECLEFFFANLYPTMPILHRQRLEQQAMYIDQSLDTYCLLSSLCAFTMLQPGMAMPGTDPYGMEPMPGTNILSGTLLMEETVRVRKGFDYLDSPSLNSLSTSYLLFACYYALEMHEKAWFYLREATTLAHMIGMNKEETYLQYDNIESSRRRRLYWLLYVTERAYALQRQRPLTLQATINPPTPTDDPTDPLAHSLSGFVLLVNLFRPFDDTFTALWNKARNDSSAPAYLVALQKQFSDVLPAYVNVADSSLNDLQPNQQWLKTCTWQLSMSGSQHGDLPVDVQNNLLSMSAHFPSETLGLVGLRLLLELSYSMTEVLYLQPASRDPFTVGPREQLKQLLNILTAIRNGDHRFLPLLLNKVHDILPRLTNPMLQNAPESAANIDIFDGFGNAGMAQPPVLSMDQYDAKFSGPRMDELGNDSGSSSSASQPTGNDMSSPFVNSPSVISPGSEFPHNLSADFGSIQEMVMTPLGPGPNGSFSSAASVVGSQTHHQAHHSMTGLPILGSQTGMTSVPNPPANLTLPSQSTSQGQGFDQAPNQDINPASLGSNVPSRPSVPSRANSFAIPSQQIRTVGDFHALQRANSDMATMSTLGLATTKLDFNTLR